MENEKDFNNGCGCGHDHDHEGCGCGHDHGDEEMELINLTLDDNTEVECFVIGIFEVEDKEYIALLPKDDERVLLYQYSEDDNGMVLDNIEDDEEFELVTEAFYHLYGDDDYDEDEDYEDFDDEE